MERAVEAVEATPSDPQLAEKASDAQALFNAKERLCEETRDRLELYQATQAARAVAFPNAHSHSVGVNGEPLTYSRASGHSIFRDMEHARRGDQDAAQRLQRHTEEMRVERPDAQFDLSSTDSAGGYLVAPLYLQEDLVMVSRAGAAAINAIGTQHAPPEHRHAAHPGDRDRDHRCGPGGDNTAISETDATFGTRQAD